MSWKSRAFTRAGALALCSALTGLFCCAVASAATISYGDFNAPPSTMFLDVEETAPVVPLYGPPTPFETGLDFDPKGFVAVAAGGSTQITDGQLNFTVMSPGLNSLSVFEAGDYTLVGAGGPPTFVTAAASIFARVIEVNGGTPVSILLPQVNSSVTHSLPGDAGALRPWSLGTSIDIAGQLAAGQVATKVEIVIDNQLIAASQPGSAAFIAKKEFIITTDLIPEPATFAMGAMALCGIAVGMRRRG
jgi:hypothetical protein